jgi:hypothetical protein
VNFLTDHELAGAIPSAPVIATAIMALPPVLSVPMLVVFVDRLIIDRSARHHDPRWADGRSDINRRRADSDRVSDDDRRSGMRQNETDVDVDSGLGEGDSPRQNRGN